MSDRLSAEEAAAYLKTEPETVQQLWEAGVLHVLREDGGWFTTRELLEGDVQVIAEAARIERLRNGAAKLPTDPDVRADFPWLSLDWVEGALDRLRSDPA